MLTLHNPVSNRIVTHTQGTGGVPNAAMLPYQNNGRWSDEADYKAGKNIVYHTPPGAAPGASRTYLYFSIAASGPNNGGASAPHTSLGSNWVALNPRGIWTGAPAPAYANGDVVVYDIEADRTEQNDLSKVELKRAKQLAAQWEAYAERANVLPLGGWRDRVQGTNASLAMEFTLADGDHLERAEAPNIAARAFTITVRFDTEGKDGVIVAQGGSGHGFALFVKNGELIFALRRGTVLTATPAISIGSGARTARARVAKAGALTLGIDDQSPVSAQAAGLLQQMPADGLDVGEDAGGLVGPYKEENGFGGRIESVHIKLE